MARYIITGSYNADSMKGLIARPSDRAEASAVLVEAAGGTMESFYLTTGDNDFTMTVTTNDQMSMLAVLMVTGASGGFSGLKTVQAFTAAEFMEVQKKAGTLMSGFKAPN